MNKRKMKKNIKRQWKNDTYGCAVVGKNGFYHWEENPSLKQMRAALIRSFTATHNLRKFAKEMSNFRREIYPPEKMFTIGFKVYHSETSIMLWLDFDSEFKAKIIDTDKYYWKFVIAINDYIPFIYEKDGWMLDSIEVDEWNKNVWHIFVPFNISLDIGSKVQIKCCITDSTSGKCCIRVDEWELGPGDYWDPVPRNRRFIK